MLDTLALFAQPETWMSLLTLTAMEIVLGIDNIVFIAILVNRLPEHERSKARQLGLLLALIFRLLLLSVISWIAGLTAPLITVIGFAFSGRDAILLAGGLFLLAKSTMEIHHKLEGAGEQQQTVASATFAGTILQVIMLDIVFSVDSVITAVGLVRHLSIMVLAVILSLIVMLAFARVISEFIERHPTMKMLALSFLLMIGLLLVVESFHVHVPKGYVYFAMAFSLGVEVLNMRLRSKGTPVKLHTPYTAHSETHHP
jgi:predicted tellurium resistance membrane protein TerC